MDVKIETEGDNLYLTSPYNPDLNPQVKQIGGKWDPATKRWGFDVRDEQRVRDICRSLYGTDGSREQDGDLVTVRVRLADHEGSKYDNHVSFAGRRIAERPGRDAPVRLAANVVVVEGTLPGSGGSMRYPNVDAGQAVVVEVRDLPRAALSVEREDSYEIVGEKVDVDALLAERERLLARVAEIDALLPEPEGTEVTTREAAAALGVSVRTVQRWAKDGKVDAHKNETGRWVVTITI